MKIKDVMISLEVDQETGCMYLPGKKGKRAQQTYRNIWIFVTGIHAPKRSDPGTVMCIAHKCDNGKIGCVNFSHLELISEEKNNRDAYDRGLLAFGDRNGSRLHPERMCRGDRHPSRLHPERLPNGKDHHKVSLLFTAADHENIREMFDAGSTTSEIALKYNISRSIIHAIKHGKHWSQRINMHLQTI